MSCIKAVKVLKYTILIIFDHVKVLQTRNTHTHIHTDIHAPAHTENAFLVNILLH